jgi:hypothetical protein
MGRGYGLSQQNSGPKSGLASDDGRAEDQQMNQLSASLPLPKHHLGANIQKNKRESAKI